MSRFPNLEIYVLDTIQRMRTPLGDGVMPIITKLGNYGLVWIFLAVVLIAFPKTRRVGVVLGIALLLEAILCNLLLKPIVARIRPFEVKQGLHLLVEKPRDYSFPSGHTMASFAAASALLFARQKKLGWIALVLAVLIAFSRLYLYMHYPTDVLAGIVLGVVFGFLGNWIVSQWAKNREL